MYQDILSVFCVAPDVPGLYLSRKGKPLLNDHIFFPRLDLECAHIGAQRKACPRHPKSVADMLRIDSNTVEAAQMCKR